MSPPDLERLVLGELDEQTAQRLREDPKVAAQERALRESNEEILRAYPPEVIAKQIRKRASQQPGRVGFVAAVAAAAVALVIFVNTEQTERSKGAGPSLAVYRKTAGAPERLQDHAQVRAGDVLQIAYSAKGARYGTIVSLDGLGVVTVHLPMAELAKEVTALPTAYELDAAPGFERFIFFTSNKPFTAAPTGPLPDGVSQTSLTLVKP